MSDFTITLKGKAAERLQKLATDGPYSDIDDALEHALDALQAGADGDLDAWLRTEIVTRAAAHEMDATRALTPDEVRARLRD